MNHQDIKFADLSNEQLLSLKKFESEFNKQYGKDFFFLAMNPPS